MKVSYAISELIVRHSKPFSDVDFIKNCLETSAELLCPDKKNLFSSVSLSRNTVTRRTEEMACDIRDQLQTFAQDFEHFSIALDESTDIKNTAQLIFFIRGVTKDFHVPEQILALASMNGTTTGADIFADREESSLACIVITMTTAITCAQNGFVGRLRKLFTDNNLVPAYAEYHCIIHQEALCSKVTNLSDVMEVVVKTVNKIRSRGLNHRQFQEFLKDAKSEYCDIIYHCDVRWLSRGKVLKRFFDLHVEINTLLAEKGKPVPLMEDPA